MKILLIRLSAIGDVIHVLPVARALRETYPQAEITWIVENKSKDLLIGNPNIDRLIILPKAEWKEKFKKNKLETLKEAKQFFKSLKKYNFDVALDVHGLFKSALTAYLSGAKKRIGAANGREGSTLFYNQKIDLPKGAIHQIDRNLNIAKGLGVKTDKVEFDIVLSKVEEKKVENLFNQLEINSQKSVVAINPYTSWSSKNWLDKRWSQLADQLITKFNCELIFTGSPADREGVEGIIEQMTEKAYNLAGRTSLKELAGIYRKSKLFIGCDTGPMHLAVASNLPVIALFGSTNPVTHGPYGDDNIVIRKKLDCSNCYQRECRKDQACMKAITVEEVFERAVYSLQCTVDS